jgi:streptomycin 3"-adenylyltransferase
MTASTGEQGEGDDDRVIALTPTQIGFALAIVIVLKFNTGSVAPWRPASRPWPPNPRREFHYGEWLRRDYEAGFVPEPIVEPDLAPQVATLLTASTSLIGLPVESLLDPVPHGELTRAMRDAVPAILNELTDDTVNVLLTLARIAFTITHGRIVTKDEAAEWAAARLPADLRAPLAHARLVYLGGVPPAPTALS